MNDLTTAPNSLGTPKAPVKGSAFFFYVITADALAGTELYIYNLAKRIREDGHSVYFVSYLLKPKPRAKLEEVFSTNMFVLEEFLNPFKSSRMELLRLQNAVACYRKEGLVCIGVNPNGFQFINHLFLGGKIILQSHNALDVRLAGGQYHLQVAKNANKNLIFDRFGLLSPENVRAYKSELGIDNAIVTANGFYLKRQKTTAKNKIIFIGRIEAPEKNFSEAVEIFKKFSQSNSDFILDVYGEYQSSNPYLHEENIQFHGSVRDPSVAYCDAKLLIMTSTFEGMPRVIVEAYDYGIPVVIYDTYLSAKEIVIQGVSGELVPLGDQEQFTVKMEKVLGQWDLYSERAMHEAEKYNINHIVNSLYQDLARIVKNSEGDINRYYNISFFKKLKRWLKLNRWVRILRFTFEKR